MKKIESVLETPVEQEAAAAETDLVLKSDQFLKELADEYISEIPEDYRELIPPDLSPANIIKFCRKAQSKGLFSSDKPKQDGPGAISPKRQKEVDWRRLETNELLRHSLSRN